MTPTAQQASFAMQLQHANSRQRCRSQAAQQLSRCANISHEQAVSVLKALESGQISGIKTEYGS